MLTDTQTTILEDYGFIVDGNRVTLVREGRSKAYGGVIAITYSGPNAYDMALDRVDRTITAILKAAAWCSYLMACTTPKVVIDELTRAATAQANKCAANLVALYEGRYNWQTGEVTPKATPRTLTTAIEEFVTSKPAFSTSDQLEVTEFLPDGWRGWLQPQYPQISLLVMNMANRKRQKSVIVAAHTKDGYATIPTTAQNLKTIRHFMEAK